MQQLPRPTALAGVTKVTLRFTSILIPTILFHYIYCNLFIVWFNKEKKEIKNRKEKRKKRRKKKEGKKETRSENNKKKKKRKNHKCFLAFSYQHLLTAKLYWHS